MGRLRELRKGSRGCNKQIIVLSLSVFFFSWMLVNVSYADNAEVLPKGIFRAGAIGKFYASIDERYNDKGDEEDVAVDYNGILDASAFPDLALVEAGFGLPTGSANIGRSEVSFEYDATIVELTFQYGITEKLSIGIVAPYMWIEGNVNARLNTSAATVAKSAALNTLAPIGVADTVPLTTQDAQDLIGNGLDINGDGAVDIQGFGFKPLETWSDDGFTDIEAGFRYQYYKNENWRLAFTGGVRFPTGEIDDPDNLVDLAFGSGTWALLFYFHQDYLAINKLVLNTTFRYNLLLPDDEIKRVPEDVNRPLTANKEEVERDLGDVIELELSGNYQLSKTLSFSLLYKYGFSVGDDISGNQGFMYQSLEDESDYEEHVGIIGLSYSTVPLFQAKKFPLPLIGSISYRNRFAGSNNTLKSQYLGVDLVVYF